MGLFHPALQAKVSALDLNEDRDLISALEHLNQAGSKKQAVACMKEALQKFKDHLDACQQLSQNHIEVLSELLFIPDSIHLHQLYISFINALPAEVRLSVEKGLSARISPESESEYPQMLTAAQSMLKASVFSDMMRNIALDIMHVVTAVLESIHECKGRRDIEQAQKSCTVAATIGYTIVTTYRDTICQLKGSEECLQSCCHVAGAVMKKREFDNVEITLSLLIYSIMVVLESNQRDASIIVLLSILGEDCSVLVQGTLQSAGGNDDKRSIMVSENASYFRNFAADLSDRQSLLFFRTISQSLLDALSSCDHGALLAVFNDIFCKVSETYRVDPWSKIYYMDSIASVLKEVCRQMANAAGDDTLFGGMPRGLEEHALRVVFDNLDDEEVIVIRSAQILLQDVLSVDKIRPNAHGGPGIMMKQALHFCSSLNSHQKSKYRILHSLEKYVTARQVLQENPKFIQDTIQAIAEDRAIKSLASSALAFIWRQLYFNNHRQCKSLNDGLSKEESVDALSWVLDAMVNADKSVQSAVTLYVLPGLVKNCRASFHVLLENFMNSSQKDETWLASCLSLLSFGKKEAVYENIKDLETENFRIFELLEEALLAESNAVHMPALELLITSAKTVDVPGRQELDLLWKYFNMMIRCTSKTSRQESIAIFVQFLRRIKVSVAAALTRPSDFSEEIHINVKFAEAWLRQLCRLCLSCLHPGGVYGKKYMGVEFLCVILEAFSVLITSDPRQPILLKRNAPYMNMFQDKDAGQGLKYGSFKPFPDELYSFETTDMLLTALLEGWDRISNVSMSILLMLPSPIPGMESIDSVSQVLNWALKLLNSPRSVESDSGAKVLMTLFIKYVSESQWSIRLHPDLSCAIVRQNDIEKHSLEIEFVEDLISLSHMAFSQAEENLASASKNGIAHGYLLALRYICPHMAVNHVSQASDLMNQVYQLLERGYQTIIPLLASPGEGLADADPEMLPGTHSKETDDEHFIRGAAWINSKEICHLGESMWLFCDRSDLMKACQGILEKMAELLLEILLQAKHYGTIDHARAALQFVCSKSNDWGSSKLSESLLDHLFSQMLREEQSRRDAIRRSGGLPFAITAVLVPHAKSYLPMMAMKRLLNVLKMDTRYETGIYWPKVHALNALRLIYSESKLSALDTFYADGFRLILMSFSDPSWEIRNAASLCFASLVSKVMGFSNTEYRDHAEFWPKRSPTASQFFEKYDSVRSFILEVLERSNASAESVQPCCESEQLLSPILALLCRLRPTIMDEQEHLSTKFQQYANLLKNCSASREMAIRKFASRAFVSVVPSSVWNVWSEQLSTSIAKELSSQHVNWNRVHGHTLLLKEILRVYYSFTKLSEDISKAVCQKLGRSIHESIPIDSLEKLLCCPPVVAELLQVCILLARLNRLETFDMEMFEYYGGTVLNLLWPVFMDNRTWNDNVPSLSAIRKRLSELKFAWVFPVLCQIHDSKSTCATYMQETHRALQCPDYEVRDAALKCLLANFETIILPQLNSHDELGRDLCFLYTTIRALWVHEPAFYPRIRMLQTLNMMHRYLWKSHGKHLILRDQLVDYYNADDGKNPALLQEIIVYSMHDALYHKTKGTAIFALGMILTYSHPQHPANLRQACLQSMNTSGLMNPYDFCPPDPSSAPDIICHTSIDQYMEFWSSVLRLLEDEEPDIRMEASSSLQQYMFSKSEISRSKYGAVRVEEIQERILQWLGGALSHYPSFTSHLQSWICIPEACRKHIHQVLAGKDDATIFKEETANQHTDPLILANLASKHLAQMATSSALSEEQQNAMHEWLGEIIGVLEDFIHSYMDLNGILYQELIPTIYEDVYRLFAALWTASHLAPTTIQGHMYKVCKLAHLSQNTEQQNFVSLTFTQPAISALMASALGHDNSSSDSTNDPHDSSFKISTRWQLV